MNKLLGVPIIAFILAFVSMDTAQAGWCGAARYRCCATCCDTCGYPAVQAAMPHRHEDLSRGRLRAAELHLLQDGLRDSL